MNLAADPQPANDFYIGGWTALEPAGFSAPSAVESESDPPVRRLA